MLAQRSGPFMRVMQDWLRASSLGRNYAFVVVAIVFLALLASAGLRSAPGVLILPLEQGFGWSLGEISFTASIGIILYGIVGPFAAVLMQTLGVRRTLVGALLLMGVSTGLSAMMTQPWHFFVTWGIVSGLGSGGVAMVLGATIVGRWFETNRGTVMGLLTAR